MEKGLMAAVLAAVLAVSPFLAPAVRAEGSMAASEQKMTEEFRVLHENTLRYGVSIKDGERIVRDASLYQDVQLPPVTDKMKLLNTVFGKMVGQDDLNLVMRSMRQAKDEKKVAVGNPTLLFYAVDTAHYKVTDQGGQKVAVLWQFVALHRKDAEKAVTLVPLGYLWNPVKQTAFLLDFSTYDEETLKKLDRQENLLKAPRQKIVPGSRDDEIVHMIFSASSPTSRP